MGSSSIISSMTSKQALDYLESSRGDTDLDPSSSAHELVTTDQEGEEECSAREKVRRNLYHQLIRESPYADSQSFNTLRAKAEQFCSTILADRQGSPYRRLVHAFVGDLQPLLYLHKVCIPFLPASLIRLLPDLNTMINSYVSPLVHHRLDRIRGELAGHQLYLSFSLDQFTVGPYDPLTGVEVDESEQLHIHLFVIAGVSDHTKAKGKKFLLMVQQVLASEQDDLSDDFFKSVLFDCLKLLWPNGDHLSMARQYLTHLITDPELDLDQVVREISRCSKSPFQNLIHVPYCHRVMYQIEADLRQRHSTVCEVIDTVRLQWAKSGAFRDKYRFFSSDCPMPPQSFYRSAEFYRDQFEQVQLGLLKWKGPRFEPTVQGAMSDPEFKQMLEDFAKHSELLCALERASYVDAHLLSCQIGSLLQDLVQLNRDGQGNATRRDFIKCTIEELGGRDNIRRLCHTGDYQLLHQLISRCAARDSMYASVLPSKVTKCLLAKWIATEQFGIPPTIPSTGGILEDWVEPLDASQLRRTFPIFWYLFRKFCTPFPWQHMGQCAMVYCFAEVCPNEPPDYDSFDDNFEWPDDDVGHQNLEDYVQSPYYDQEPKKTHRDKSLKICERIIPQKLAPRARVRMIVRESIRQCLPFTRIRLGCSFYDRSFTNRFLRGPTPLAQMYAVPLYEATIDKIRSDIDERKLFISLTMANFKNANEVYHYHVAGFRSYMFVIVGLYGRDEEMVLTRYVLKAEEVVTGAALAVNRIQEVFEESLKLLWPGGYHLTHAQQYLTHLIIEPEFEEAARVIQESAPFRHLTVLNYTHRILYQVDRNIRMNQTLVDTHPELMQSIGRATAMDPHFVSRAVGNILSEVIKLNQAYSDPMSQQLFAKVSRARLNSGRPVKASKEEISWIESNGDYQLLTLLIERLLLTHRHPEFIGSEVTKWHLLKSVANRQFRMRINSAWTPPLRASQLERCFPAFWSMFIKFIAPLPWQLLEECAVLYCYYEALQS